MKQLKKMLLILVVMLLFSCEKEDISPANNLETTVTKTDETTARNTAIRFDVYIRLVTQSGQEIPASTLPGYGAENLATGAFFYDSIYEPGLFESLPVGTYRFIARDGYFDGASSAIVDVTTENEAPEGWVYATLRYWSE